MAPIPMDRLVPADKAEALRTIAGGLTPGLAYTSQEFDALAGSEEGEGLSLVEIVAAARGLEIVPRKAYDSLESALQGGEPQTFYSVERRGRPIIETQEVPPPSQDTLEAMREVQAPQGGVRSGYAVGRIPALPDNKGQGEQVRYRGAGFPIGPVPNPKK